MNFLKGKFTKYISYISLIYGITYIILEYLNGYHLWNRYYSYYLYWSQEGSLVLSGPCTNIWVVKYITANFNSACIVTLKPCICEFWPATIVGGVLPLSTPGKLKKGRICPSQPFYPHIWRGVIVFQDCFASLSQQTISCCVRWVFHLNSYDNTMLMLLHSKCMGMVIALFVLKQYVTDKMVAAAMVFTQWSKRDLISSFNFLGPGSKTQPGLVFVVFPQHHS